MRPDDIHNRALVAQVHPADWQAPPPADRYNLVVIGGGPAGLVAALGAAGLGARVALIERGLLGGDCLNWGCVPSKAVLRAAHTAAATREASSLGLSTQVEVNFGAVMERMRRIRASIGPHDSADRLAREGVDVFFGEARFLSSDTVSTGEVTLRFARCCIATGARAARPPIAGIDVTEVLDNEGLFSLTERPEHLIVVGAGVIGCEMAQAFARLGSKVSLVGRSERVLPREEPDASELVAAQLRLDGVALHLGGGVVRFEQRAQAKWAILADGTELVGSAILLAVGRRANTELNLEAAGVGFDRRGIQVDDHLRTSNPKVYAAGDVIGQAQFTHAADHQARIVLRNALFFGWARASKLVIPRVTYTHPEVASVGVIDGGTPSYTVGIGETDRGRTDGETAGYCRIWADAKGRIHGATVVGEGAGELLAPITLAMTHGLTLGSIASTIHPYPTRSEVVFKVASAWNKTRMKPWILRLFTWVLSWRR